MHDLDSTLGESEQDYEYDNEISFSDESDSENPFTEEQEIDLASELLSVSDEAELDLFLGDLIKKAAGAVRGFVKSPAGQALGGYLKKVAKKALPVAGRAIGGYFGGSSGGNIGAKLGSAAGNILGLELEGLSPEDRDFEVAKNFVRLSGSSVRKAIASPRSATPQGTAKAALTEAAQRYAPGLVGGTPTSSISSGRSGRWVRRGRKIILFGA